MPTTPPENGTTTSPTTSMSLLSAPYDVAAGRVPTKIDFPSRSSSISAATVTSIPRTVERGRITNIKSKSRETCVFTGSVIISNNVRLANMPVLRALQGRIRTYHFRPTTSELVAMLRHLAETIEHPDVDAEERQEICEFIIAEAENSQQQIDLRLLKHAISDYVQWKSGEVNSTGSSSRVEHAGLLAPVQVLCREERKTHEQDHILELIEERRRRVGRGKRWSRTG